MTPRLDRLAVLRRLHRALCRRGSTALSLRSGPRSITTTSTLVPQARARAWRGRSAGGSGRAAEATLPTSIRARLPGARDAGLARRPRRLRFAMQGLGSGAIAIAGSPRAARLVLPKRERGEWLAAFALSEKRRGLRRGGHGLLGAPGRRRLRHRWREDLDLQRRHRRCLHSVRRTGEAPRRARYLRLRRLPRRSRASRSPNGST